MSPGPTSGPGLFLWDWAQYSAKVQLRAFTTRLFDTTGKFVEAATGQSRPHVKLETEDNRCFL